MNDGGESADPWKSFFATMFFRARSHVMQRDGVQSIDASVGYRQRGVRNQVEGELDQQVAKKHREPRGHKGEAKGQQIEKFKIQMEKRLVSERGKTGNLDGTIFLCSEFVCVRAWRASCSGSERGKRVTKCRRVEAGRTGDASLVGGDGSALDTDVVLLASLSGVESNLIVGSVTVLHAEIEVLDVKIEVGEDKLCSRQFIGTISLGFRSNLQALVSSF